MSTDNYEIVVIKSKMYDDSVDDNIFKIAIAKFIYYGDGFVAEKCGMDEYDYQILMQRKFNGSMWNNEIIFLNKSEAINAKEYLQSLLLARRLANVSSN